MNVSGMGERGYQPDFFTLSESVRDPARRLRKATKIRWVLTTQVQRSLAGATCLDVGCSSGLMTASLAPLFAHTVGLDYDAIALGEVDQAAQTQASFLRGDAMALPFPAASIDVVICAQVYEHVPDARQLFAEIDRVLKPGGLVFFSGPNWLFPIEPHYFLPFLHWLPPRLAARYLRRTGLGDAYYERSMTAWTLRRLLKRFALCDLTPALMQTDYLVALPWLQPILARLPAAFWSGAGLLLPNFNWLLRKPASR